MVGIKIAPTVLSLLLVANNVQAWTPPLSSVSKLASRTASSSSGGGRLFMSSEEPSSKKEEPTTIQSFQKQIAFDEGSGRFYETSLDQAECIPDEEYCTIDPDTGDPLRLTVAEKERIFLDALQSYYVSGRQLLPDDEFDLLKEDLTWNGSPMVIMNRNEATYLAAVEAYLKGEPMMSDAEFDKLKLELKESGSKFAVETEPKCYIDTGICKVTLQEDKFRSNLLYLPAGAVLSIVWLGIGFELIEPIIRLNPLFLALLGSPLIYNGAKKLTEEFIFENKLIAYGPCPSCEAENRVYFGNILGVEGFSDQADVKCPNCGTMFTVQRNTLRASTVPKND